jgi:hypothetical protein
VSLTFPPSLDIVSKFMIELVTKMENSKYTEMGDLLEYNISPNLSHYVFKLGALVFPCCHISVGCPAKK